LKITFASVLAVSVLPTQVGPRNKKLQIGLFSSFNHALALLIALDTAIIASSCHITFSFNFSSKCINFSFSDSISLEEGILVHFATISAISFETTLSLKYALQFSCNSINFFSDSTIFFSSSGISAYLILATSPRFHSLSNFSA